MALAETAQERQVVQKITEPGRYGFQYSGEYIDMDSRIQDFLKTNFPRISELQFSPAHLTSLGDYVPAKLSEFSEWERMSWEQNYIAWENMMGEKEYYNIVIGGSYSGGSGTFGIRIEDIGKLSIGRDKLNVQIEDLKERDGKIHISWHGTAPHRDTSMDNGSWSGYIAYEGEKPGSLVKATKSFMEKMVADGLPLWRS